MEAHHDTAPYPNPHTPAERRTLSNIGHRVEGGVLAAAASLALLDALKPRLGWPGRWSPRASAGAGFALGAFILGGSLHHGGPFRYLRHEHQDRQHLQMAAALAAGGLIEARGRARAAGLGGAGAMAFVGASFLRHEQHGTEQAQAVAVRAHRTLGGGIVGAAAAKAADALGVPGPWKVVWPGMALVVAGRLLAYREPSDAYE